MLNNQGARQSLTIEDFVVVMNALLIEVYADFSPEPGIASEKLTGLANRLHGMASNVSNTRTGAIIVGLATALMMTEDGG